MQKKKPLDILANFSYTDGIVQTNGGDLSWQWQCREHGRFTGKSHELGEKRLVLIEFDRVGHPVKTYMVQCKKCGQVFYLIDDLFSRIVKRNYAEMIRKSLIDSPSLLSLMSSEAV